MSWGATVWEIARSRRFPALPGVRIVPAIAAFDELDVRFQTNEIARRVAHASGAQVSFLHSPALPSAELRRSLVADPDVSGRIALWDRLAAALVGIGPPARDAQDGPAHVLAARAGLEAAVGDVVSRYFDLAGRPVPFAHEERLLGMSREQLRATGTVVAVAAGVGEGAVDRGRGPRRPRRRAGHGRRDRGRGARGRRARLRDRRGARGRRPAEGPPGPAAGARGAGRTRRGARGAARPRPALSTQQDGL